MESPRTGFGPALIPDDAQTIDDLPTSLPSLIEVVPELKLNGQIVPCVSTSSPTALDRFYL